MTKGVLSTLGARLKSKYFWWSLLVGLVCLSLSFAADRLGFFSTLELKALDLRFIVRGTRPLSGEVIIVAIDDEALKDLPQAGPWPWPPTLYAEMIKRLTQWGAAVVAMDLLVPAPSHYAEPSARYPKGQDAALASVARESGNVVWAGELDGDNNLVPPNATLRPSVEVGFVNFPSDGDSFIRRTVIRRKEYESFVLSALEVFTATDLSNHFAVNRSYYINYRGPPGTYPMVSMGKVLTHSAAKPALPGDPEELFGDKIVLVGVSFHDSNDFHPTPFYRKDYIYSAGIEIHANVVDSVLGGDFLRQPSDMSKVLAFFGFGAVSLLVLAVFSPLHGLVLLPFLVGFYTILNNYLFAAYNWWIALAGPLVGVILLYTGLTCYRQLTEEREKRKIKRTYENLREVDELKTNFMSLVSHDLKTPVARIKNTLQLILMEIEGLPDEWESSLGELVGDCDNLTLMISNILSLNRLEAQEVSLDQVMGDLSELILRVTESLETEANEKSIAVDTSGVEPVYVEFDEGMITQVLNNLVGNAIKYSPTGGHVTLLTAEHDGFIEVSVKDTGYGISQENIPFIFEKFYRVEEGEAGLVKGTGLGLYLCRYLIELHGGSIDAESTHGKGSTFTFRLPY
jgi:signal transduction histidine kinase